MPDSPIGNVVLRNVTLTADKDFTVKDAPGVVFESVNKTINENPAVRGPEKIE